jgi:hypothetical protein
MEFDINQNEFDLRFQNYEIVSNQILNNLSFGANYRIILQGHLMLEK